MLHYVHHRVSHCVCLMFGAGQLVHSVLFHLKQLPAVAKKQNKVMRVNQKLNKEPKLTLKLRKAEGSYNIDYSHFR